MKTNLEELLQPYQKTILTAPKYSAIKGAKKAIKFKSNMQRELKFRIWNVIEGKWNGIYNQEPKMVGELCCHKGIYLIPESTSKNLIVQQYTGLKDKNGVDIYEGDILERIGNGSFCKIVIYWDDHHCAFYSKNSFNLHGRGSPIHEHNINISDWTYWVVCGNIFENSELLEA